MPAFTTRGCAWQGLPLRQFDEAYLARPTFRAEPGVRQILKGSARRGVSTGLTRYRVVDVSTNFAFVSVHLFLTSLQGVEFEGRHSTLRTPPSVRQILKGSARRGVSTGLTQLRVVDVVTHSALVFSQLFPPPIINTYLEDYILPNC